MLLRVFLCVLLLLVEYTLSEKHDSRLIQTTQGPVRGYKTPDGELFAFYSIPYATAPTGVKRFKAPLPAPVWITPFKAVDRNILCPQPNFMGRTVSKNVQEDCLIANVYVPATEHTNLPVVVLFHGGGYHSGNGQLVTPMNLVRSKKIIAVTFNYRLGAHGFLCLGTVDAPGNAGMKDQVALLRWVNKNIANFGGNPDDVTIDGFSAGASSVDLMQLSKITKGLFNKVIPQSGANVAVWSVQIDPLESAKKYARKLNFTNSDDIYELEEFYKTASYELLTSLPFMDGADSTIPFTPCIERDTGVERFLEEAPVTILKKGEYNKLPMLYGFSDKEGLLRTRFGYNKVGMNVKFSDYLPADLQFENVEEQEAVAKKIKEFYFGDKEVGDETVAGYINYQTDVMFSYPILRSLRLQVEAGNDKIYLYEYSFTDEELPLMFGIDVGVRGADHCAQTAAVLDGMFVFSREENHFPERFKKMKTVMRELWINFITTGEPVPIGSSLPAWPPAGADRAPHMSLDETLQLRGALLPDRARFWDEIYERHYRAPVPPPTPTPRAHHEL